MGKRARVCRAKWVSRGIFAMEIVFSEGVYSIFASVKKEDKKTNDTKQQRRRRRHHWAIYLFRGSAMIDLLLAAANRRRRESPPPPKQQTIPSHVVIVLPTCCTCCCSVCCFRFGRERLLRCFTTPAVFRDVFQFGAAFFTHWPAVRRKSTSEGCLPAVFCRLRRTHTHTHTHTHNAQDTVACVNDT